jgi:plasmid maintenance system antidote protein VapI
MSDTSPSLLQQLANRAKRFHENTGIAKATLARAISVNESNYCAFLSGKRGLSANSTCLLLKYMNMTASDVVATFSRNTLSSKITSLQEKVRECT